jgi:hypothetical protein
MRASLPAEQQCSPRRMERPRGCRSVCRTSFGVFACTRFDNRLGRDQSSSVRELEALPRLQEPLAQSRERGRPNQPPSPNEVIWIGWLVRSPW